MMPNHSRQFLGTLRKHIERLNCPQTCSYGFMAVKVRFLGFWVRVKNPVPNQNPMRKPIPNDAQDSLG